MLEISLGAKEHKDKHTYKEVCAHAAHIGEKVQITEVEFRRMVADLTELTITELKDDGYIVEESQVEPQTTTDNSQEQQTTGSTTPTSTQESETTSSDTEEMATLQASETDANVQTVEPSKENPLPTSSEDINKQESTMSQAHS